MAGLFIHAGLNVSGTKLQLVEVLGSPDGVRLDNLNEVVFAEPIDYKSDNETKILGQLQTAFDEFRLKKPVKSRTLSFSLPLELFYISQLPFDNTMLHRDNMEEFKWEFSVMYPFLIPEELILQYLEVEKNMIFTKNTALVYAIERKYLKMLEKFCEQNDLKLGYIDNAHLASEKALALSDSFIKRGLRLSIYVSDKKLSIILSLDGKTISQKVHNLGNQNNIRQIIEDDLSPTQSKNIKKGLVQAAYITGESVTDLLVKYLTEKTGITFITFNPFDKLTTTPKILESNLYSQKYNSFSSAAGIAYRIA
jgi:Tfp pilus assembly PilM family ATPase